MSRVFLSFLGLGTYNGEDKTYGYSPAVYMLDGRRSSRTEFVQVAELGLLEAQTFDKILIVATQKSYDANFKKMKAQLTKIGGEKASSIIISEDMSAQGQWEWFEKILTQVSFGDELTIDLTHGYRSIPIVFSAAINFLQKAKHIKLNAVYYGAYDMRDENGIAPIFDMKDFYFINEWTEAVSRLVEDADARKMAHVAGTTATFQVGELNQPALIDSFDELTDAIRNVDVNRVGESAAAVLQLVGERSRTASETGRLLLGLVSEKFSGLALNESESGKYDGCYFRRQLEIIRLLLEHKLFMQAFTVMREFVGSIALIDREKFRVNSSKGRKLRHRFSGVFVNMLQYSEDEWKFQEQEDLNRKELMPFYQKLKSSGVESLLREFTSELIKYRNGFDHAWTGRSCALPDVEKVGMQAYDRLKKVVLLFAESGLLN